MSKNGYIALYKGKKHEVWANSSYEAQQLAATHFRARKTYEVDVYLCQRADGRPVTQSTCI